MWLQTTSIIISSIIICYVFNLIGFFSKASSAADHLTKSALMPHESSTMPSVVDSYVLPAARHDTNEPLSSSSVVVSPQPTSLQQRIIENNKSLNRLMEIPFKKSANMSAASSSSSSSSLNVIESGMKTIRIINSHSQSHHPLPVISQNEPSASASLPQQPQSQPHQPQSSTTTPNTHNSEMTTVSPPHTSFQQQQQHQVQPGVSTNGGGGLVRRLSVTARPGDIFYKVKDVTETSSTTDAVGHHRDDEADVDGVDGVEAHSSNDSQSHQQQQQQQQQQAKESLAQPAASPIASGIRRTTTWNVKKNQQQQQHLDIIGGIGNSNEPASTNANVEATSSSTVGNAEPGSPMFAKELLSIR